MKKAIKLTERQNDRQADRQKDRHSDRQGDRERYRVTNMNAVRKKDADEQTDK